MKLAEFTGEELVFILEATEIFYAKNYAAMSREEAKALFEEIQWKITDTLEDEEE